MKPALDIPYPVCTCGEPYDSNGVCPTCHIEDPAHPDEEYDDAGDCAGNLGEFAQDDAGFRRCDCEDYPCCGH